MFSTTLVITFISVGSVFMESNIKELCSQKYFHSFIAKYSKGKTSLQLNRHYNEMSYHSWDLLLTEDMYGNYNSTNISYVSREGQTPNSSLTQPDECSIPYKYSFDRKEVEWSLRTFQIRNQMNGPKLDYTQYLIKVFPQLFGGVKIELIPENKSTPLYMSSIVNPMFSGLLCETSNKIIYLIVEDWHSRNAKNRTQFVSELRVQNFPEHEKSDNILRSKMKFTLDSTNKDVIEFLGIGCPNITTDSKEEVWISTKTLYKIFWGLSISAVILAFIDLLLSIWRLKQRPTENTDADSDVNTTTVETHETRKSHGSDMRKAIEIMADPEKFFANL